MRSYHASIDPSILVFLLHRAGVDRVVTQLIRGSLERVVEAGGVYRRVSRGIPLGSPLSPLLGALYLAPLDDAVARLNVAYARFMDDWVLVAPSRWALRRTVAVVNDVLETLKVEKHPDKTFVGRAERGFDFLGYRCTPGRPVLAAGTVEEFGQRVGRLYEQGAGAARIGDYVTRWRRWARAGLGVLRDSPPLEGPPASAISG